MKPKVAVPLLRVADVARSGAWYRDILGFEIDPFPDTAPYDFAILRHGPTELMLSCSPVGRPSGWEGGDVYVRLTGGLRELYARLQPLGVVTRRMERMFPLWQQTLHQVNHATQHRSEAAAMLTQLGHSPGWLDFLYFIDVRSEP